MKKSTKKTATAKTAKVKKVRTAEQKAARKERRKQRRANVKAMSSVKESIASPVTPVSKPSVFPWAEKVTSDGLPYSQSVDNPDSLLGQLKRLEITNAKAKAEAELKRKRQLEDFRTPRYSGHSGKGILHSDFNS